MVVDGRPRSTSTGPQRAALRLAAPGAGTHSPQRQRRRDARSFIARGSATQLRTGTGKTPPGRRRPHSPGTSLSCQSQAASCLAGHASSAPAERSVTPGVGRPRLPGRFRPGPAASSGADPGGGRSQRRLTVCPLKKRTSGLAQFGAKWLEPAAVGATEIKRFCMSAATYGPVD